jgi:hypothetical protein
MQLRSPLSPGVPLSSASQGRGGGSTGSDDASGDASGSSRDADDAKPKAKPASKVVAKALAAACSIPFGTATRLRARITRPSKVTLVRLSNRVFVGNNALRYLCKHGNPLP